MEQMYTVGLVIAVTTLAVLLLVWQLDPFSFRHQPTDLKLGNLASWTYNEHMQTETIEIKAGETVTVDRLHIKNLGGGHKILPVRDGKGGGDLSYAELELETTTGTKTKVTMFDDAESKAKPFVFEDYLIRTKSVNWNGESVGLEISTMPQGEVVDLEQGESKTVGDISLSLTGGGLRDESGSEIPYIILEITTSTEKIENTYEAGQGLVLAKQVIKIKTIATEKGKAEIEVIQMTNPSE